jgi:uncharacterized delta-60 repeat protein
MRVNAMAWTVLAALVAAASFACAPALASPIDRDFGKNGIARYDSPGDEQAQATLLQSNGRIVVGGTTDQSGPGGHFALTRFKPGGSPDKGFGTDGLVVTTLSSAGDQLLALAQQPDGKIVAVGSATKPLTGDVDTAIARYNADGSLDTYTDSTPTTAFGAGSGSEILDLSGTGNRDFAKGVVVQPDGAIVVGYSVRMDLANDYDFAATRLTPDGLPDASFGSGGTERLNIATGTDRDDQLEAMTRQPDGKLLLAGTSNMSDGTGENDAFSFARLNGDGTVDDGGVSDATPGDQFGADGTTTVQFTPLADRAFAAAVQPDGKIVAAGSADLGGSETGADFALTRLDADGTVDSAFGAEGDGKVTTAIASGNASESAVGLAIQADGKIVADGFSGGGNGFELARYTRSGKLDRNFDHDGKLVAPRSGAAAGIVAIAGRLIATGSLPDPGALSDFAAVRYLANDRDSDGVTDSRDNCEGVATRNVRDSDRDGRGDACDSNDDDDRLPDKRDHCPRAAADTRNGCPATNHSDRLIGTAGSDHICGLFGNDLIRGLGGDDSLSGDDCGKRPKRSARKHHDGNDRIYGGAGSDELFGGGGNDLIKAGTGRDVLFGARGNDRLFGGPGGDRLVGGSGNDRLVGGGRGQNSYSAGAGNDVVVARNHIGERIRCGSGRRDLAIVDRHDFVVGCERVRRAR